MAEEMVDVHLNLPKDMAEAILKMTKKELINRIVVLALRNHVQDETVQTLEKELKAAKIKLNIAESYVEQGRAMINAVMERWYEYDV